MSASGGAGVEVEWRRSWVGAAATVGAASGFAVTFGPPNLEGGWFARLGFPLGIYDFTPPGYDQGPNFAPLLLSAGWDFRFAESASVCVGLGYGQATNGSGLYWTSAWNQSAIGGVRDVLIFPDSNESGVFLDLRAGWIF